MRSDQAETTATATRSSQNPRWVLPVIGLVALWVGLAFDLLTWSERPRVLQAPSAAEAASERASAHVPVQRANHLRATAPVPEAEPSAAADLESAPEDATQARERNARELLTALHARVHQARIFETTAQASRPEAIANSVAAYAAGWVEGVMRATPELSAELADAIDEQMCSEATSDAELIVLARVVAGAPELANPKGLGCVLSRHVQEDAVLWSALDAWQINKLEENDAIREISRTARDPRTLTRLLPIDERRQRRGQAEQGVATVVLNPPSDLRPEDVASGRNDGDL